MCTLDSSNCLGLGMVYVLPMSTNIQGDNKCRYKSLLSSQALYQDELALNGTKVEKIVFFRNLNLESMTCGKSALYYCIWVSITRLYLKPFVASMNNSWPMFWNIGAAAGPQYLNRHSSSVHYSVEISLMNIKDTCFDAAWQVMWCGIGLNEGIYDASSFWSYCVAGIYVLLL